MVRAGVELVWGFAKIAGVERSVTDRTDAAKDPSEAVFNWA